MSKRLLVEQKHTKAGIEFIKEGLEEFGIEKKQTIKTMLLVEEVLVKLREHAKDPDEKICIILNKRFGRVYVNLSLRGEKFQLCAQLRVCSQAGGIPVYPRFSQPDNSESWDDAGNGI